MSKDECKTCGGSGWASAQRGNDIFMEECKTCTEAPPEADRRTVDADGVPIAKGEPFSMHLSLKKPDGTSWQHTIFKDLNGRLGMDPLSDDQLKEVMDNADMRWIMKTLVVYGSEIARLRRENMALSKKINTASDLVIAMKSKLGEMDLGPVKAKLAALQLAFETANSVSRKGVTDLMEMISTRVDRLQQTIEVTRTEVSTLSKSGLLGRLFGKKDA